MTTLRVLLAAAPASSQAEAWALFDAGGRRVRRGRDIPSAWPTAERREVVLAADLVRVVALKLPPMPPSRLAAAAAFALEDQLAITEEPPAIAVTPRRADGTVLATVAARTTIAAAASQRPRFERVVAEAALAPVVQGWAWYASGAGGGFVRREDGSAFSTGASASSRALPAELAAAIAQASRAGHAPPAVAVAQSCDDDALAQWSEQTGIRFVRAPEWQWDDATAAAFEGAADLLEKPSSATPSTSAADVARMFRPALAIAGIALALHATATLAQWAWFKWSDWRSARALVALAQDAGLSGASSADTALRAIARRNAELRHRAGLSAPADALPLLARAAPALSALPAGVLKSATFADGAWTMELGPADAASLAAMDRSLANAGVAALQAKTAAGHRVRITLPTGL